jgi:hypothetical protein
MYQVIHMLIETGKRPELSNIEVTLIATSTPSVFCGSGFDTVVIFVARHLQFGHRDDVVPIQAMYSLIDTCTVDTRGTVPIRDRL